MYKVYVNGEVLYDSLPMMEDDLRIYSPVLNLNKEGGTFQFTIPKDHPLWNVQSTHHPGVLFLSCLDQIVVHNENGWLWEGFPVDYSEDFVGNYNIVCEGALHYLENVFFPLTQLINKSNTSNKSDEAFLKECITSITTTIVNQHNSRLDDLKSKFPNVVVDHQKIYCNSDSKIEVKGVKPPYHFSRISNFESCYDALQKRVVDDFGGYYYLTKPKDVLVINYSISPPIVEDACVILGKNLLDYNVSEEFRLATAVIPRGNAYDDNHPGESRWWMKDERSAFYDIEQRADYRWRGGSYEKDSNGKYHPTGGSRIFLPNNSDNDALVKKYGMKDVIIEFDSVVAKYPVYSPGYNPGFPRWKPGLTLHKDDYVIYNSKEWDPTFPSYVDGTDSLYIVKKNLTTSSSKLPNRTDDLYEQIPKKYEQNAYGWPFYAQEHTFKPNAHSYKAGERLFYTVNNKINVYEVIADHVSNSSRPPNTTTNYYRLVEEDVPSRARWLSYQDYIGESPYWDTAETATADYCYICDYTEALRILGLNYLTNQQYNKLVLSIEASKISFDGEESLDPAAYFGKKLPVSANLFGTDLKPFEVTEVAITLDDDSQSTFTLGGEDTKITRLVRERTR